MCELEVRFNETPDVKGIFAYSLEVEVISSKDIPPKIFVYHQRPAGLDGNTFAEFSHVATPVDFSEIPEDAASEMVPWFRTDKCTLWLRGIEDLKLAKQLMVDDIIALKRSFDLLLMKDGSRKQTTIRFADKVEVVEGN